MGRNRVLSFISQWSAPHRDSRTPTPASSPPSDASRNPRSKPDTNGDSFQLPESQYTSPATTASTSPTHEYAISPAPASAPAPVSHSASSSPAGTGRSRSNSRPLSMVQTYQPALMDVNEDTLPELQPIFTFLNSHTNKLYQEGYFLKLDDQDNKGKPNPDRTWTECFAQLVGTVLSLWDAAELDAAGEDGEVLPKFINLTDASIKMIESLPTRTNDEQPLQNILSISTAGRNRYLLHFNSHHSLLQWTSGIRLAMFEHSTLQEAYTGALIAGKGKNLNNIGVIMERARAPIQEWVRVRFGAGVPWRRCWCVIEPPNEKEYQKVQKDFKKRSPYDRSHPPLLKGEIRFYDTKKDAEKKKKNSRPIATITEAYSAYAIYPQAKALIDGSTLLKLEGNITIHSDPPSATEGFVFIMPEIPPAVTGFEMLLRFLFPTWDTFGLYGRPGRLVASVLDPRSLMFAMPKHRRYGYLEIMDVSTLILTEGSSAWTEKDWRKKLKELTGRRMTAVEDGAKSQSRSASRSSKRLSFGPQNPAPARPRVGFADDGGSVRSSRSLTFSQPGLRTDSAPPDPNRERAPSSMAGGHSRHVRNSSDTQIGNVPQPLAEEGPGPQPSSIRAQDRARTFATDLASTPERVSSEDEMPRGRQAENLREMQRMQTPEPVNAPPAFAHGGGSRPQQTPYHSPDLRRATSRLSSSTLAQLATANGLNPDVFKDHSAERQPGEGLADSPPEQKGLQGPAVQPQASVNNVRMNANFNGSREALTSPVNSNSGRPSPGLAPPDMALAQHRSKSPLSGPNQPGGPSPSFRHGPQMGPPPRGRGTPPTMSPRGPPPDGRGFQGAAYGHPQYHQGGPPPGPRRTPPPNSNMPRPPQGPGDSPPINRKPLPQRTTSLQGHGDSDTQPRSPNATGGAPTRLPYHMYDGGPRGQPSPSYTDAPPRVPPHNPRRQASERSAASSHPDDASTASPDYASTRRSTDTQASADRPRAGVLRTIGTDSTGTGKDSSQYDIPEVNFGPTINYAASKTTAKPGTRANEPHPQPQPPASGPGRRSPGPGPALAHFRQESDDRRTVPWGGAAAVGPSSSDSSVTPHQFVQQRAAAASPTYLHQRNPSANTLTELRSATPTSPLKRPGSHGMNHSRQNSADLLQSGRPVSQGTAMALSGGEVSSHLSAREQEHVARVMGGPLIALSGNKTPVQHQGGLVGQIDAIEREKAQMREGIQHRAVQAAYVQPYAHQQAQYPPQPGYGAAPSPRMMGAAGGGMPSPYGMPMGGMANPGNMGPGPGVLGGGMNSMQLGQPLPGYGPQQSRPQMGSPQGSYNSGLSGPQYGGGWNQPGMPNMAYRQSPLPSPPGMGMQNGPPQQMGFQAPPQGQYPPGGTPTGPRPGTPGRMQYQGQAF